MVRADAGEVKQAPGWQWEKRIDTCAQDSLQVELPVLSNGFDLGKLEKKNNQG